MTSKLFKLSYQPTCVVLTAFFYNLDSEAIARNREVI